jgi:hypothetical protein
MPPGGAPSDEARPRSLHASGRYGDRVWERDGTDAGGDPVERPEKRQNALTTIRVNGIDNELGNRVRPAHSCSTAIMLIAQPTSGRRGCVR